VSGFRAASGAVDLEPLAGSWLTGFAARPIPSDGQLDPILARAALLDDGNCAIAIVACDLIGIDARTVASLRSRIADRCSIPAGHIVISCTHTHSAPATLRFRGVLGNVNQAWWATAQEKIVSLVAGLEAELRPAALALASTVVDGIGYNRQDRRHPIDTELACIAIDDVGAGEPMRLATLVNYAVHPVTLSHGNLKLSGDIPGATTAQLSAMCGGVGLYLQGACGDVNPASDLRAGWGNGTVADVAAAGERLAQAACEAMTSARWTTQVRLNTARREIDLPLDPPPSPAQVDALIAQFEADLRRARAEGHLVNEGIALVWLRWAAELKGAQTNGVLPAAHAIEIWAAAINDLRLAAAPLEPYADIGLGFKRDVRPCSGMFLGYANGLLGYCATDWAKEQGGYGPDEACRWFPEQLTAIGRGAAQRVAEASAALARGL
jgi:hypothetical protein